MAECTIATCTEEAEYTAVLVTESRYSITTHSLPVAYCSEHLASQKRICNGYDGIDLMEVHPIDAPECRYLICDQQADFEVTIRYFGGIRERKALYCTEHLTLVQRAIAKRETSEITNTRPIEKGTTVEGSDYETYAIEINKKQAKIASLEADVTRINKSLGAATTSLAHVVRLLHQIANDAERRGETVVSDIIDERLDELALGSRKKRYEMLFTVPVQMRVSGEYTSEEAFREAFSAGSVHWDVANYEDALDDDIKILEITEMKP